MHLNPRHGRLSALALLAGLLLVGLARASLPSPRSQQSTTGAPKGLPHLATAAAAALNARLRATNSLQSAATSHEQQLSPVILVPGDGGSRLQAKLNRRQVSHQYCERQTSDWFDLWLNLSLLVPFAFNCWIDNMKLEYNATSRTTQNAAGVDIRVHGFGQTESVEYVNNARLRGTSYFDALVKRLVALGYQRNQNIYGAPYDFRRAPNEMADYFESLRELVEKAYADNNNEPVVFVCHSMGCLHTLYLLRNQPNAWKKKYIRSMVSLSGAWGGSVKAIKALASGDNFGVIVIPALSLRKDVRTFPSLAYLLPSHEVWPKDKVLVKTKNKLYTIADYKQFFDDINYPVGYEMWLDVRNLTTPSMTPGVETYCFHGTSVSTPEQLDYHDGEFPDAKPKVAFGDGDGTVNVASLQACRAWSQKQKEPVHYKNFDKIDHMAILTDDSVLDCVGEALVKP